MSDIKLNIEKILKGKHVESNKLDYKSIEYDNESLSDFFKDIISFLNSDESYGENKYIIFGVSNGGDLIGLKKNMRDDNEYQNLVEKIRPRPEISSGQINIEGYEFGFIFIPGKNNKNIERIYEMDDNYFLSEKKFVAEGQGFIRRGTKNCLITNSEREDIYQKMLSSGTIKNSDFIQIKNAKKNLDKKKYENKKKQDVVEFECEKNNNSYSVLSGSCSFSFKLYIASTNMVYIRPDKNQSIGYEDGYTVWPPSKDINYYDKFGSDDLKISKNESFIIINDLGKILGIRLLSADSKTHGALKDKITFEYKCLD